MQLDFGSGGLAATGIDTPVGTRPPQYYAKIGEELREPRKSSVYVAKIRIKPLNV